MDANYEGGRQKTAKATSATEWQQTGIRRKILPAGLQARTWPLHREAGLPSMQAHG